MVKHEQIIQQQKLLLEHQLTLSLRKFKHMLILMLIALYVMYVMHVIEKERKQILEDYLCL